MPRNGALGEPAEGTVAYDRPSRLQSDRRLKPPPAIADATHVRVTVRHRLVDTEDGFTLVECIVALIVFALFSFAALTSFLGSARLARSDNLRVQAAGVAERQLELVRNAPLSTIPVGLSTSTTQIDNSVFTLAQTTAYEEEDTTTSACDSASGSKIGYLRISETVTWNQMGSVRPVRTDTLRHLGTAGLNPNLGAATFALKDRNNSADVGFSVTLTPGGFSSTSGTDGCVVFNDLTPGTFTASVSATGYVNDKSAAVGTAALSVTAGSTAHGTILYDRATSVAVTPQAPNGYTIPAHLPITLLSTYFPGSGRQQFPDCSYPAVVSGFCSDGVPDPVRQTHTQVWPDSSGYGLLTGDCNATVALYSPLGRSPSVPGGTTVGTAVTGGVQVSSAAASGNPVYAVMLKDAGCPNGDVILLGPSGTGAAPIKYALPYGPWGLVRSSTIPTVPTSFSAPYTTVTVTPSSPTPTATVS